MTTETAQPATVRQPPRFTGVIIHRDPRGRFAVRHATDWHTFEIYSDEPLAEGAPTPHVPVKGRGAKKAKPLPPKAHRKVVAREGIGFYPDPNDPATVFTVWASPLGEHVVAEDLDELKAGVDEALRSLEGCHVEESTDTVLGNLIRFERVYTFRERAGEGAGGAGYVRKRKQWLLYVDQWLICVTWQGSSVDEYAYWFAMANQSFLTFELPQELWFYTDREMLAQLSSNKV